MKNRDSNITGSGISVRAIPENILQKLYHTCTLLGTAGQRATTGLFPKTDQYYLGFSPAECGQSRGIIQGYRYGGGHW